MLNNGSGLYNNDHWQSFTAGSNGELSQVSLWVNGFAPAPNWTLTIYEGNGVAGTVVYSENKVFAANVPGISFYDWVLECDLLPTVIAGNSYTFRIQGGLSTLYVNSNDYPGGYYYNSASGVQTAWDMKFKTYIKPTNPTVTLTPTHPICAGDATGQISAAVVSATGGLVYNWSSGGTLVNETGLGAGTYNFSVTDGNSCVSCPITQTLMDPPLVTVSAGSDQTECQGNSAALNGTATNAFNYTWTGGGTIISPTSLSTNVIATTTGTYTLTVSDLAGCTATANTTVNIN